jgi:PEGA domain
MSLNYVLIAFVVWTLLVSSSAQVQTVQPAAQAPITSSAPTGPTLEDGTPVKLRIGRTVSSADAHVGETVDFEVLEEVRLSNLLIIPKDGVAWATVTEAQSKRRMARGGKLDMNIDSVRLVDGEKVALRAVKEVKGGGHTGAMTGAMVGTAIVFFPAAPLFLFMHGKDITIPKGTEITAYVNGNFPIDTAKFQPKTATNTVQANSKLTISSVPDGADIEVDGSFVGNTPSVIELASGDHSVIVKKPGYKPLERKIKIGGGDVRINAELEKNTDSPNAQ